jgi:hypothetical protein
MANHKATKFLHTFGAGNTANLDSLRSARPTISSGGRWGSHIKIVSATKPNFDQTWHRLSPSGSVEKYLSMDGSMFSYVPIDSDRLVRWACRSGVIALRDYNSSDGVWTILVPRSDVVCDSVLADGEDAAA